MATKREMTIEELQAQYEALGAELEARKKAEAEEKKAKLAADKQARYDEIVAVYKHFEELRNKYVDDYGYFTFESTNKKGSHDWYWNSVSFF